MGVKFLCPSLTLANGGGFVLLIPTGCWRGFLFGSHWLLASCFRRFAIGCWREFLDDAHWLLLQT
jgi:hypothetical protein